MRSLVARKILSLWLSFYVFMLAAALGAEEGSARVMPFADQAARHWAFLPLKRPIVPRVQSHGIPVHNPVDAFVLHALAEHQLKPSAPADARTLIRRLSFDLIGLPPKPDEVEAFAEECRDDGSGKAREGAVRRVVERLLASPHYGERWGRHWLDVARFAETDGFEHDAVRPHAWRYRDYVVRSLNADKPYDRFIQEQIAGDELFAEEPDALIATAFNLLGPDMVDSSDQVQRRLNTLSDMTDTAASAFLGLTLGCARCHDHKFEPFTQRDYYRFQAHYASTVFRNDLPVPSSEQREAYQAALRHYNEKTRVQLESLAVIEAPYRQKVFEQKLSHLNQEAQEAHRTPMEQRTTDQANLVLETARLVQVSEKDFIKMLTADEAVRHKALKEQIARVPKPPSVPLSLGLQTHDDKDIKTHILLRGDYNQRGEEVSAGFPASLALSSSSGGKRTDLARWIASAANPLTARVLVNRVWQHHFGRGIVETPGDFGLKGASPTHPELLNWLAADFIEHGWSLKHLHRRILTSETWQQSSTVAAVYDRRTSVSDAHIAPLQMDPDNKLLWRMNRLRLEGEIIRDSLLAISGRLHPAIGGPGVFPPIPDDVFKGAKGWSVSKDTRDHHRRSIYIFARRNLRFPFLEVFDAPDSNLSCSRRDRSTTAPQSLTLLNTDEVIAAARLTAAQLERKATSTDDRVTLAYRLTLCRTPTAKEMELARAFLEQSPLNEFCRALFNLNEFVYVE